MKMLSSFLFICCMAICCRAQPQLTPKDLNNLIAIGEAYSHNPNARGDQFVKAMDSLSTPALSHMTDALKAIGRGDSTLLQARYLSRPGNDELKLWYVIREIHYNRISETKKPLPDREVAEGVLQQTIDERWLIINYYYHLSSGLAMLFNKADLSHYNFDLNSLGFKNPTEKAIFYLQAVNSLFGQRFRVLLTMKNYSKIIEYALHQPLFDGKPYYAFTTFDFPDFEYIGYDKKESYKHREIGDLLSTLMIQFMAEQSTGDTNGARELYFNSILYQPQYFQFTEAKDNLQRVYDQAKAMKQ